MVELRCFSPSGGIDLATRLIETHHDLDATHDHVVVRGRVVDILILHADGSTELLARLPSGEALRGFDEHDNGHLETAWTRESVTADSDSHQSGPATTQISFNNHQLWSRGVGGEPLGQKPSRR